jgi:hypothetical protein
MRLNLAAVNFSRFRIADRDNPGRTINFDPNPPQDLVHKALINRLTLGEPLWAIILKARRVGISTDIAILNACHCIALPNATAMTVAHRAKNAKAVFLAARNAHQTALQAVGLPWNDYRTQHELTFPHALGDSTLTLATAKTVEGARGMTLTALHLSEAAFYDQAEDAFTALISTVAYKPETMLIIESTANGKSGIGETFYEYWQAAIEGKNNFKPIFISWLMDPGCTMPVEAMGVTDRNLNREEKELVKFHSASLENLSWRRWAIPNRCQGYVDKFHQEFPTTPEEAFITSGDPAFTPEEMSIADKSTRGKPGFYGSIEDTEMVA